MSFLGMAGRDSTGPMQDFVDRFGLRFPQAVSEDGSLWAELGVAYQPAWIFVNDDGRITRVPTSLREGDLRSALDQLVET